MIATTALDPLNLRVEDLVDVATRIEAASRALAYSPISSSPRRRTIGAYRPFNGCAAPPRVTRKPCSPRSTSSRRNCRRRLDHERVSFSPGAVLFVLREVRARRGKADRGEIGLYLQYMRWVCE